MFADIASDVSAVATAVLAAVTIYYAFVNRKMLRQMEAQSFAAVEQAQATMQTLRHLVVTSMPRWVHAAGEGATAEKTGIRLRNNGNSPAEAIEVSFRPPLPRDVEFQVEGEATVRPVMQGGHLTVSVIAPRTATPEWEGELMVTCIGGYVGGPYAYELPLSLTRDTAGILHRTVRGPGRSSYPEIGQAM